MLLDTKEGDRKHKKSGGWRMILKLLFSHVGLFFLVVLVAVLGAYMFQQLELPAEERRYEIKKLRALDVKDAVTYLTSVYWRYREYPLDYNFTRETFIASVSSDLKDYEKFIIDVKNLYKYDGKEEGWVYDWTFPKAVLFTITIMTTIGYGHIAPKTAMGKTIVIIYAMLAIPILLVFLANIGESMASNVTWLYSRVACRWCRVRRNVNESKKRRLVRIRDEEVGEERYMPTDKVTVPIMLNLVIIFLYISLGAILFSYWEDWPTEASFYFTFVTLTTIGFGDMVPGNSFLDYSDSIGAAFKMLTCVLYCVFGMALVSMCINLMQEQIMAKAKWLAREIGLVEDTSKKRRQTYEVKRSKGVIETPSDKRGVIRRRKKKGDDDEEEEEELSSSRPTTSPETGQTNLVTSRPSTSGGEEQKPATKEMTIENFEG